MKLSEGNESLVNEFNCYAGSYDQFARVQHLAADELAVFIKKYGNQLPNSKILELGCGTGLLTEQLVRRFPDSMIIATDISSSMLDVLSQKMDHHTRLQTLLLDANLIGGEFAGQGCIVSGMTLQWLSDPVEAIHQWMNIIHTGGFIFLSWLGDGSFPEWKKMTMDLGISYTGNILPGREIEEQIRKNTRLNVVEYQVQRKILEFDSAISFFKSIRNIGASTEIHQNHDRRNMLQLCRYWDKESPKGVSVEHELHYLVLRKL
jgi:malonyl-CoA O-methyltransferase